MPPRTATACAALSKSPMRPRQPTCWPPGNFLWNAGIFLFSATDHRRGLSRPRTRPTRAGSRGGRPGPSAILASCGLRPAPWASAEDISIDYAVMEKARQPVRRALLPAAGPILAAGMRSGAKPDRSDRAWSLSGARDRASTATTRLLRSEAERAGAGRHRPEEHRRRRHAGCRADRRQGRAQDVKLAVHALKATRRQQAETFPARSPALGLVRKPGHRRPLSGQAHRRASGCRPVAAKPPSPVRTLDRGARARRG